MSKHDILMLNIKIKTNEETLMSNPVVYVRDLSAFLKTKAGQEQLLHELLKRLPELLLRLELLEANKRLSRQWEAVI